MHVIHPAVRPILHQPHHHLSSLGREPPNKAQVSEDQKFAMLGVVAYRHAVDKLLPDATRLLVIRSQTGRASPTTLLSAWIPAMTYYAQMWMVKGSIHDDTFTLDVPLQVLELSSVFLTICKRMRADPELEVVLSERALLWDKETLATASVSGFYKPQQPFELNLNHVFEQKRRRQPKPSAPAASAASAPEPEHDMHSISSDDPLLSDLWHALHPGDIDDQDGLLGLDDDSPIAQLMHVAPQSSHEALDESIIGDFAKREETLLRTGVAAESSMLGNRCMQIAQEDPALSLDPAQCVIEAIVGHACEQEAEVVDSPAPVALAVPWHNDRAVVDALLEAWANELRFTISAVVFVSEAPRQVLNQNSVSLMLCSEAGMSWCKWFLGMTPS